MIAHIMKKIAMDAGDLLFSFFGKIPWIPDATPEKYEFAFCVENNITYVSVL